jgi:hypothetical protein
VQKHHLDGSGTERESLLDSVRGAYSSTKLPDGVPEWNMRGVDKDPMFGIIKRQVNQHVMVQGNDVRLKKRNISNREMKSLADKESHVYVGVGGKKFL